MDQGGDILSALLSDPEKLSAAVSAVSSMLGNSSPSEGGEEIKKPALPEKQSDGAALLKALNPFLSPERQVRADKAIRLLSLAALASEFKDLT